MGIGSNIRAGAAYVEVTAETSKLQRNLTSAQAQLQAFGRTCTSVGKDLLMLSGAMAVPLVMAAKSFAGFDDSMRLVQAVTQATGEDFKDLTALAQRLGRETSYTAQQVADAMVSLGRMGFSPKEIQAAIADVLNLARATGTDLTEAGDIAANSLRIFGLEAQNMADVSDVLTVTANSSAQTLTDLFEALKMGGPQAAAAGESIRETCASLAILANLGIKGSLAGTALRKSFSQFSKVKVQEQLRAVGVETVDANGNLRKMAEIMRDIAKVMQTMPTAEKLAFAEDIFDIRGSLAGLTLTANTDELDAMMAKLMDVEGVAADTAQKMDAGLGGSFRLLMSAVEGAMNAIADAMNGTLQPLIKRVTDVINVFTQWIEQHKGLVTAFAITVASAATLGIALVAIGIAAKGVAAGLAVVQTVTKGFALVQGVCIAKAVALKSSFGLMIQAFTNYRNMAIPALVGTEQFCAALGVASTAANRARASIILMSNAEAAAAVKSAIAAKWRAMADALTAFRNSAIAATIATKAQAAAEMALGVKTAIINGWLAMTSALKGLTVASISATIALKSQAIAEGAMTAGRAIAAGWQAMTTALAGLTVATVSATVATKAHTVAEAFCTAGTIALNAARKLAIATTAAFTAINLKAALAVTGTAVANFLLAAAAKIAAVAMMALSAVMTFIAAHPVMAAFIALGIVLAGLCIWLYRAGTYTAKLSDEASKLREKNDQLRRTDEMRMERLKQLASKQRLTNAEMAEARVLADKLQKKYGDLGITLSENAVQISDLAGAAKRLESVKVQIEAGDMPDFDRLKNLSLKTSLTVDEQGDAEKIIARLEKRYGNLGVSVDRVSGKIVRLNNVSANLQDIRLKVKGADDLQKVIQLQKLASQSKLDTAGITQANTLITQLTEKYGVLGIEVDATNGRIVALTEAQQKFAEATRMIEAGNDPLKETHLAQLKRLQELANQERLTAEEQKEAETIVNALNGAYDNLGIGIDKVTGKLNMATNAQQKFNDAMKQATLAELRAEISEMQANINELNAENASFDSYWQNNLWSQISGKLDENIRKRSVNTDKIIAYRDKIHALRKRIKAIEDQKPGSLTGSDGEQQSTEERIAAERQRQQQDADAAANAEKRVGDIERQWRRERQTELENEIEDITALRDEYKKLIQTMLDFEKAKAPDKQDKQRIADLERKLVEADRIAEERIATAKEKAARKLQEDVTSYQERFDDSAKDIQRRRAEQAQDRDIDDTLKSDKDAGIAKLEALIKQYKKAAEAAKAQFDRELKDAQADGKIDNAERRRIEDAHEAYTSAESLVDKYSARLRNAQSGTQDAAERTKDSTRSVGAWSAEELDALLGGNGNAQERTAKASESIAANTKETNRQLRRLKSGGSSTTLTYA